MLDIQNLFHKVLALVFVKDKCFRGALSSGTAFQLPFNVCGSYAHFPIQTSFEKCRRFTHTASNRKIQIFV